MRTPSQLVLTFAMLLCSFSTHAQTPRDRVDGVAQAIEGNFYDVKRAGQIASDLRAAAERGEFDTLKDPRDLATVLTDRLQPLDHHFRVSWSADAVEPPRGSSGHPPSTNVAAPQHRGSPMPRVAMQPIRAPQAGAVAPRQSPDFATMQRRNNYGVRRVEVQPGNIGYIDLREFADFEFGNTNQPARQAIEAALQLVSGTDALIIDLR
ncbi:MAG TPA: hypothetical protein VGQ93_15680, partial [Lysobacter sp.]|nr:hypothetical protein [Lysobacter sp.]